MALVPNALAQHLKADALYVFTVAGTGIWDSVGTDTDIISPLWYPSQAVEEGNRQAAFLAGPLVKDALIVTGQRRDLMAKAITAVADREGYQGGVSVFVIGVDELDNGTSRLTVLRKLAS